MGKIATQRRASRKPQIGDLRSKVSIYRRGISAPVFGDASFSQSHELICSPWAKINSYKGLGTFVFDGVDSEVKISHIFTIRYRSDIISNNIIKFDDLSYKIRFIDDPERRKQFLFLFCMLLGDDDLEVNR